MAREAFADISDDCDDEVRVPVRRRLEVKWKLESFRFMDLPPELRNRVYNFASADSASEVLKLRRQPRAIAPIRSLHRKAYFGLMQSNRQLRSECRPIFLRDQRVQVRLFDYIRYIEDFVIPGAPLKNLSHIQIKAEYWEKSHTIELARLGKVAVTRKFSISKFDSHHPRAMKFLAHALLNVRYWVPMTSGRDGMALRLVYGPTERDYQLNGVSTGEFLRFDDRRLTRWIRTKVAESVLKAMGLGQPL